MIKPVLRVALVTAVSLFLSVSAFALDKVPFTTGKFKAAQSAGKPILVDIWASWCPTCKAQGPVLEKLAAKPEYKGLTVFEVNFDTQKDAVRSFGARTQSTLIAFKGSKETARSAGDTTEDGIEKVVKSAF